MIFEEIVDIIKNDKNIFNNIEKLKMIYSIEDIEFAFYIVYGDKITKDIKTKRKYQKIMRNKVIKRDKKCILTGEDEDVCEAAHIKPESNCSIMENLDLDNYILLSANMHKRFDNYLWSINPDTFNIVISKKNKSDTLNKYNNVHLNLSKNMKKYIEHHYNKFNSFNN